MPYDSEYRLDATDRYLLNLLAQNARLTLAALGRRVRLSAPAVAERLKRLEERGIVRAYRADVDVSRLGRRLQVYVRAAVLPKDYARFRKAVAAMAEISECCHVTGDESFVLRAAVSDVTALETLVEKLSAFGPTRTSVILSTSLDRTSVFPDTQRLD